MSVVWAATSPSSGRFEARREGDASELFTRLEELRVAGSGYLEAGHTGREHELPYLSLHFKGDRAVIERFNQDGSISLLYGDGSAPSGEVIHVPLLDDPEPASYSAEFSSTVERAIKVLGEFLDGSDLDAVGTWFDL